MIHDRAHNDTGPVRTTVLGMPALANLGPFAPPGIRVRGVEQHQVELHAEKVTVTPTLGLGRPCLLNHPQLR